jgi:Protein of unknown function (DUF4065)
VKIRQRDTTLNPKDKKLREVALYLSDKSQGDETFGATKLNKLLFYADFLAYLNFGKPITGQEYFRLPKGPAPRRWVPVRDQMIKDGDLRIKKAEFHGFPQDKPIALRDPDLSDFSGEEIALIAKLVELHRGKTASEISDESHGFIGWKLAAEKETIPYEVVRLRKRPLTEKEHRYAISMAKKLPSHAQAIEAGSLRAPI